MIAPYEVPPHKCNAIIIITPRNGIERSLSRPAATHPLHVHPESGSQILPTHSSKAESSPCFTACSIFSFGQKLYATWQNSAWSGTATYSLYTGKQISIPISGQTSGQMYSGNFGLINVTCSSQGLPGSSNGNLGSRRRQLSSQAQGWGGGSRYNYRRAGAL